MDTCKRCNKTGVEFYESNKSWCKECIKDAAKASRLARIDEVRAYDRLRGRTARKRKCVKRYEATERGKERRAAAAKAWVLRNPEKRKAQVAVSNAIRDGKLTRQPCEDCGAAKSQAHHDDYSKAMEVRWKCARCHASHHRQEREQTVR